MLATTPRTATGSTSASFLRTVCTVQAVALLGALLTLAWVDNVFELGVACLGLGGASGALVWRLTRTTWR